MCRKRNIYEKLDTINPYLFGFKNGVYDLKNKTFRLPTPEEYISCTCKYKYETPNKNTLMNLKMCLLMFFRILLKKNMF